MGEVLPPVHHLLRCVPAAVTCTNSYPEAFQVVVMVLGLPWSHQAIIVIILVVVMATLAARVSVCRNHRTR